MFPDVYFQHYNEHFTIMGFLDPEIQFGTADEFVGGYLVHQHVVPSGRKAHAMLPPSYVVGATSPVPSPTYIYRPGGTEIWVNTCPVHAIYMAAIGRFLQSPMRFCLVEAPAKEWLFNDTLVPWILPESYRNPRGVGPEDDGDGGDNGDDEVTGAPLVQETRLTPVVTTGDSTGESKGFETVDEGEEAPINKVVISIPAKDVAKPEGSGQAGKDLLFESEEDTDPEVQRQIEATRDSVSVMQELHLSEEDDDDPGDSDDHGEGGELDELNSMIRTRGAKRLRHPNQNRTTLLLIPLPYRTVLGTQMAPIWTIHPGTCRLPNPQLQWARVPTMKVLARPPLPKCSFQRRLSGYRISLGPLSSMWPHWHKP